jgi:hypothetical protein
MFLILSIHAGRKGFSAKVVKTLPVIVITGINIEPGYGV